ncbi:hypothetical protein [Pseudoxanthomonas composti]|uniref:Uncharacterized protein n=1 Tax=Pseudoxanthomonas composti TaxID=2137479 RepID=A0A4Q1JYX3_9GAMM|nr:hypothetical protein [Pseudoxanthomonas composti]RXR07413.1 hypothetical protein EPA99_05720 [Pseudoxanthomonas composti]
MKRTHRKTLAFLLLASFVSVGSACAAELAADVAQVRDRWAQINYRLPKKEREAAFEALSKQAASARAAHPQQADALIWEGIVLSSLAGEKGGMGALGLVKQARGDFEAALKLDSRALGGAAYTSLGALYYQVPGWPLGFGNDNTARQMLGKGLEIDPSGIDANYFYGDFLRDQGQWAEARAAFEKALAAPARPGREVADAGRRAEAQAKLDEVKRHLAH